MEIVTSSLSEIISEKNTNIATFLTNCTKLKEKVDISNYKNNLETHSTKTLVVEGTDLCNYALNCIYEKADACFKLINDKEQKMQSSTYKQYSKEVDACEARLEEIKKTLDWYDQKYKATYQQIADASPDGWDVARWVALPTVVNIGIEGYNYFFGDKPPTQADLNEILDNMDALVKEAQRIQQMEKEAGLIMNVTSQWVDYPFYDKYLLEKYA